MKHGLQIGFGNDDGPSFMNYDIFGDGYLPDGLVLRQGFNDGWSGGGGGTQFIRDQWIRNVLTALGTQNSPGVWSQLYVNGLYWGVYNICAHVDQDYAAHFFGGKASNYDTMKDGSQGIDLTGGNLTAWYQMFDLARYGNINGTGTASLTALTNPTAYALMATYLNLPSFCDYIIANYWGGNWDWDWHNFIYVYNTASTTGAYFQDWDGEGVLWDPNTNICSRYTVGCPTELFVNLMANSDFRQMFADHVYKDLTTVLSATGAAAIYQALANTISPTLVNECRPLGQHPRVKRLDRFHGHPRDVAVRAQLGAGLALPLPDGHHVLPVRGGRGHLQVERDAGGL